jgi:hypothetical protein
LYGGKICAALDRQHPRDLFDIKLLIENEGLADETRRAFIVYLISHPRPMAELLSPNLLDIESTFNNEFIGMTRVTVALDDLLAARQYLLTWIHQTLTHDERRFILSVKNGQPDWSLSPFPDIDKLPAVKWKLLNIMQMNHKKRESAYQKLKSILDL